LHASSFFGYIFIDPSALKEDSLHHIVEHECIHRREWHSIDRMLTELFLLVNWFNPVAWMYRKSVIENLEYLADSAVINRGTDSMKYQWSILNQYIGSASITNQFSSQIKKRINMLNKDYKLGSGWKLILTLPLVAIAFFLVSCAEKEPVDEAVENEIIAKQKLTSILEKDPEARSEVFYIVEEMPQFNGGDAAIEFRKYIAQNLRYPTEAAEAGVSGRIIITFVVTSSGKVVIPSEEDLASIKNENLDEVVVVTYRPMDEEAKKPEEKHIKMLREEVIRVVSESPEWTPGKQRGIKVNVLFTFPVNFVLQ